MMIIINYKVTISMKEYSLLTIHIYLFIYFFLSLAIHSVTHVNTSDECEFISVKDNYKL